METLTKTIATAGLAFFINLGYRVVRIDYIDYKLDRAEKKFQEDWNESKGCPFDLVKEASALERELVYERDIQDRRIFNLFYRLTEERQDSNQN